MPIIGIQDNTQMNSLIEYLNKKYPNRQYDCTDAYEYIMWREGQQHVIQSIKTWIEHDKNKS